MKSKIVILVFVLALSGVAQAQTTYIVLEEDFEGLTLGASPEEAAGTPGVWTDTPPPGWFVDESGVPGIGDPATDGVADWAGWAFTNKDWWVDVAGDQNRSQYTLGQGTVAVADPDEWDDSDHADSAAGGWYKTFMETPAIDIFRSKGGTVQLKFDSSWRPEFDTDYHQTAETHLKSAFLLEPDLIGDGLKLLNWRNVSAERWVELIPDTWPARRRLLSSLAGSGHRTEALALLEEMLQLPQEKEFLGQAASWAVQWGDPRLALEAGERWQAEELANRRGGSSLARATLAVARVHMTLGDPAAAYQAFRSALDELVGRSGPSSGASLELLTGMATVYLQAGQIVMAQSLFQKATDLAPYHAPAFLGLARTERRAGNLEAAVDQYREALRLEPEDERVTTELDGLLLEMALTPKRR